MQTRYMNNVYLLPKSSQTILESTYHLPLEGALYWRLHDAGVDHAMATLVLLHCEDRCGTETLLGHAIKQCPRQRRLDLTWKRKPQPVLTYVADTNPRVKPRSRAHFDLLHTGMSLQQALTRGVTWREIREWSAEGSIRVEKR